MLKFSSNGGDKGMEEIIIPATIAAISAIYYGMNPLLK
jgi:hypothetical protein